MADEKEQPILEETPEEEPSQTEETPQEEAPAEETKEEPKEPEGEEPKEEEPKEETLPAEEEPEEKPPSPREEKRIQQLLSKMKEQSAPQPKVEGGLDYSKALDADPEVIARLEEDRKTVAEQQYLQGLEQAKSLQFHTRLEIDAPKVESKYPQLDKNSSEFDAQTADDINSLYLHLVGYDAQTGKVDNPNLRYADFVETQVALSKRLADKQVAESSQNIAKQAATTGLRPDGSSAKRLNLNKAPEQMTDEELDAVLAQMPKTSR